MIAVAGRLKRGASGAGLFVGAAAWALNTQVGYAAVPWSCEARFNIVPLIAVIFAAAAFGGALLSWRAMAGIPPNAADHPSGGRPDVLLAGVGVGAGLLFALVILAQGAAGFVVGACLR